MNVGPVFVAACAMLAIGFAAAVWLTESEDSLNRDDAGARAAFQQAADVFRHPRCANCHAPATHPLQGDNGRRHVMSIRRGPDGHGRAGMTCANCHREGNADRPRLPPGAPNWHMPPTDMPMVFHARSDGALCEQLKDRAQNGDRSLAEIVKHIRDDPLVAWSFDPGPGRTPVPMSHATFQALMSQWAAKGAACPPEA